MIISLLYVTIAALIIGAIAFSLYHDYQGAKARDAKFQKAFAAWQAEVDAFSPLNEEAHKVDIMPPGVVKSKHGNSIS